MAIASYKKEIDGYTRVLKKFRNSRELFDKEKDILDLMKERLTLYKVQIHTYLAPKRSDAAEAEIQEHIKNIFALDLPVCEAKIRKFQSAIETYDKRKDVENSEKCFQYLQKWLDIHEGFYALVAFRSLEHFCNYLEWDKEDKDKVWKYSIDPYNDGGYTGVNKPFFYYFNQMVLKKQIKFISKQQATGTGKCLIPETKIMTPNGTMLLKDINVGDEVYSMKDNKLVIRKVTNKWTSFKKQVRITVRSGASVTVSPEHRMLTARGYQEAKNIDKSDYLYKFCSEWESKEPTVINDDILTLVTCMLFDGHCKSSAYMFTKTYNTKIIRKFLEACKALGITTTIYKTKNENIATVRVWQNEHIINGIMQEYGLDGKLSKEKRLPKQFFNMSIKQKYDFLGLMFATDGYIPKRSTAGITLASKELVYDIQKLLNTCGVYSYIVAKRIKKNGKLFDAWVLNIPDEYLKNIYDNCYCYDKQENIEYKYNKTMNSAYCNNTNYPKAILDGCKEFKMFVSDRWKRNKTFKRKIVEQFNKQTGLLDNVIYKDFVWENIKSIEYIDSKTEMMDIEVEEVHNFIANGLVSHNSYSNSFAISWVLGMDCNNDVLLVLGNPALVASNLKNVAEIIRNPKFVKVFPQYEKYLEMQEDKNGNKSYVVSDNIFSTCRTKEGELTLADSNKPLNLKVISKDTSIDGIRVKYLFLDDVCRSKDAGNMKQHETDISNFWNSWWKRNYGTDDFYIVVGGTAYSIFDIISQLINYYSKGKMKHSDINKYTFLSLDDKCVFIKVPKIDTDFDRSTYPQKFPYSDAIAIKERDYRSFMAMEQQTPMPPENSPFYIENINTYDVIPDEGRSDCCWASLDTARVGFDNNSMPIMVKVGDKFYLKDCLYLNEPMDSVYPKIVEKIIQHHITKLVIEKNIDVSLKTLLSKLLAEQGVFFCDIIEVYATVKKEEKIYNMEQTIKTYIVFPASHLYSYASQMGKFMNDVFGFSYIHKNEHDDSIDSLATFCQRMIIVPKQNTKAKLLRV